MRQLTFALQFQRPPGQGEDAPAVARSLQITTVIGPDGVTGTLEPVPGETAVLKNGFALNHTGDLFFEWGTITFGNTHNTLSFTSVGAGALLGKPDPASGFSQGTVMWKVTGGTGAFAGATGAITSNFLVNLETNALIDNHLYLIYLP